MSVWRKLELNSFLASTWPTPQQLWIDLPWCCTLLTTREYENERYATIRWTLRLVDRGAAAVKCCRAAAKRFEDLKPSTSHYLHDNHSTLHPIHHRHYAATMWGKAKDHMKYQSILHFEFPENKKNKKKICAAPCSPLKYLSFITSQSAALLLQELSSQTSSRPKCRILDFFN